MENTSPLHQQMLKRALELAHVAAQHDEMSVGAVVDDEDGKIWEEGLCSP